MQLSHSQHQNEASEKLKATGSRVSSKCLAMCPLTYREQQTPPDLAQTQFQAVSPQSLHGLVKNDSFCTSNSSIILSIHSTLMCGQFLFGSIAKPIQVTFGASLFIKMKIILTNTIKYHQISGLATFLSSFTPVFKHIISVQLQGSIILPLVEDFAYNTPRFQPAVEKQTLRPSPNDKNFARTMSPGRQHLCTFIASISFSLMYYFLMYPSKCCCTFTSFSCSIRTYTPSSRILKTQAMTMSFGFNTTDGFFQLLTDTCLSSMVTFPKMEAYNCPLCSQMPGPALCCPLMPYILVPGVILIIQIDSHHLKNIL